LNKSPKGVTNQSKLVSLENKCLTIGLTTKITPANYTKWYLDFGVIDHMTDDQNLLKKLSTYYQ
jgi:hypothetical protein